MRKSLAAVLIVLLLSLLSCGDGSPDSPTTPTPTPTLAAAQLAVQIVVNQATATTNLEAAGPATQERKISTSVTVNNAAGSATATIQTMRIFGAMLVGASEAAFNDTFTPAAPANAIPGGASQVFIQDITVDIGEPFAVDSFFDVFTEITFTDTQGNSGTTPPVSTPADPNLTLPPRSGCVADADTGCFDIGGNDRFKVEVDWRNEAAAPFQKAQISQRFDDGAFYFFTSQNDDLLVQLLDNCASNDHFWVFFSANTSVELDITIEDTQSSVTRHYTNALGQPAEAITDSSAFATCPGPQPIPN